MRGRACRAMLTHMAFNRLRRALVSLDMEERILNAAALIVLLSLFFPWLSGEWLGGDSVTYSGFGFYTSFLGLTVGVLHACIILLTILPHVGILLDMKRRTKEILRLILAGESVLLTLSALSVLTKVTYDFSRIEIRFGIYLTLIASIVVTLYTYLRWQECKAQNDREHFKHPDDTATAAYDPQGVTILPPAPPPPPPLAPEEHNLHL